MSKFVDRYDAYWIDPNIDSRTLAEVTGEFEKKLEQMKRDHIVKIIKQSRENLSVAGPILGIPRPTLYYHLEKYGIKLDRQCKRCGKKHC